MKRLSVLSLLLLSGPAWAGKYVFDEPIDVPGTP